MTYNVIGIGRFVPIKHSVNFIKKLKCIIICHADA